MSDLLSHYVSTYRESGLCIDTNVFLLFVVGTVDVNLLSESKRTAQFTKQDYERLMFFLSLFPKKIITPHVITETCNLLDTLNKKSEMMIFAFIKESISKLLEQQESSAYLSHNEVFMNLGIADSSIHSSAKTGALVITDDFTLYSHIASMGREVVNFNHLRSYDWI